MGSLIRTCSDVYKLKDNNSVKNIFSINNYNGTASDNNNVITGLDMTQGNYLIKIKNISSNTEHALYDNIRGNLKELNINKLSETSLVTGLKSFSNKGFVLGNSKNINNFNDNYVVTTIKKIEKFFDIVTYVGDGFIKRVIPHNLNCEIGMISIKALDIYSDWIVRHKDAIGELILNTTSAQANSFSDINDINIDTFTISENANLLGVHYVAYIYAHDSAYNGKIQCGSYIGGTNVITNTVLGNGKLLIPENVNLLTIICRGGTGGNNIWYDPGQPFIAEIKEQIYIAPVYGWKYIDDYSLKSSKPITSEMWNSYSHTKPLAPTIQPTKISDPNDSSSVVYVGWWTGTKEEPVFWSGHYSSYLIVSEQLFIAYDAGQEYKAPTSGGGPFTGEFSTFTLNEINYSFAGGDGGPAMSETKVINLINSKNKILSYSIAKGGSLVYSYVIGNSTDITINYFLPAIKYNTSLTGSGSIVIPTDITKVIVVCSGGVGTNDAWTDPGYPYVAPTLAQDQKGLPQYPNGLPPFVQAVTGVTGQGNPAYPMGLPPYVASVSAVTGVTQQGLPKYPYGLPPYSGTVNSVTGGGIPEYPKGLPVYKAAQPATAEIGNVNYPKGLVPYIATVGDVSNPDGPPVYVAGVGDPDFLLGLLVYVAAKPATLEVGVAAYPLGLPVYVAGVTGAIGKGEAAYPNGLPPYVAPVTSVGGVTKEGNAAYPNGLPYYIASVTAVTGRGKALYPEGLEPYVLPKPATTGQVYKAPSSGGGDHLGVSSTIFLYDKTFTFTGSFGVKPSQIHTETVLLNGLTTQTLVYNIPATGNLSISYDIPNYDNSLESTFEPFYLIIKKLTDNGEWYEIDCRNKDFQLKLNSKDSLINNDLIEIKKNGFIANSKLINELNQHYAYLVIRK